jgi:uncharacterized protein (DUF1501 family)
MQHASACSCSRRHFLRGCGLTLTGFGVASLFPTPLVRHALAGTGSPGRRLLFVFLRGGNDGINAVIPHGDPQYNATSRPTLYIPPASAIDLNGFASLHPALGGLTGAYDAGELAVLHRIGYAGNTRSHFDGQRIWENGDPTRPQLFEGWLYRYIQESALSAGVELPVFTVQGTPPVLLRGQEKFVNVASPANFNYIVGDPPRGKLAAAWRGVAAGMSELGSYEPVLSQTGVKLADTLDEYQSWDQANWNPLDPDSGWSLFPVSPDTNQAGFSPNSYGFFTSLKVAALALLESDGTDNGTRIAGTQLVGFDTHNGQGQIDGTQAELLSWLAYGLASLRVVLSGAAIDPRGYAPIWDDTLLVTLSEFGRTTDENGSGGTDHAAASCQLVMGGTVNGGVYNCDPSTWPAGVMYGVNGRYLLERTDYRSVFWEILRDHMGAAGATADAVFPGYDALGLGAQELGLIQV